MLKVRIARIKLGRKYFLTGILILFILVGIVWVASSKTQCSTSYRTDVQITTENSSYSTEVVATDAEKMKGLSGRSCIGTNNAMLFSYETSGVNGIWMKDMNFAIDIVWLDANKKIISMKENATPESYPEIFYPANPARYIVEFPVGSVTKDTMEVGDSLYW